MCERLWRLWWYVRCVNRRVFVYVFVEEAHTQHRTHTRDKRRRSPHDTPYGVNLLASKTAALCASSLFTTTTPHNRISPCRTLHRIRRERACLFRLFRSSASRSSSPHPHRVVTVSSRSRLYAASSCFQTKLFVCQSVQSSHVSARVVLVRIRVSCASRVNCINLAIFKRCVFA